MKLRLLLAVTLPLAGGGCAAGVPAAVAWTTVGAGLGATAAALTFDTEALKVWDERHPPAPPVSGQK